MKKSISLLLILALCLLTPMALAAEFLAVEDMEDVEPVEENVEANTEEIEGLETVALPERFLSIALPGAADQAWTYAMSDDTILTALASGYAGDETGAGGLFTWAFAGAKAGETMLTFTRGGDTYAVTVAADEDGVLTAGDMQTTLDGALAPVTSGGPMGFALTLPVDETEGASWIFDLAEDGPLTEVVTTYIPATDEGAGYSYVMLSASGTATGEAVVVFTREPSGDTLTYTFDVSEHGVITLVKAEGTLDEVPEPVMMVM